MAGRIVDSRPASNRFLHDLRKTIGDLAIDNHYRIFRDRAHKHGLADSSGVRRPARGAD